MRKKIFDDKFNMPTQLDVGTAEKDVTEPTETPHPLAKGSDGLPKFNELQDSQKKRLPKAMRSQVAFQQQALQHNNLQVFNFSIADLSVIISDDQFFGEYNTAVTTGNVTDCIMFGVNSTANKGVYYNIVDIKTNLIYSGNASMQMDSFVEFYTLQNITSSTTSLGKKIPRQDLIDGTSSGTVTFTTTGAKQGYQYFTCSLTDDSINIPQGSDGLRCSGIALKTISLDFTASKNISDMSLNFQVYVDFKTVGQSL